MDKSQQAAIEGLTSLSDAFEEFRKGFVSFQQASSRLSDACKALAEAVATADEEEPQS